MKKKKNRKNVLKLIAANTLEKAIYSIFNNNDDESQRMEDNIRSKPSSSPSTVNDLEEQQIILNNIEQILYDSQFTTNVILTKKHTFFLLLSNTVYNFINHTTDTYVDEWIRPSQEDTASIKFYTHIFYYFTINVTV